MDRPKTRTEADPLSPKPVDVDSLVLPSRRLALETCRAALNLGIRSGRSAGFPAGPLLLTGDSGVGKTWLWRRIEAESPTHRRWVGVDLTPSNNPADFYRLIAHELGLSGLSCPSLTSSRVELVDFLAGRQADGERIGLVVEEAHNLSSDLWEEVRVLGNRLDRPGGFASMVLVGQTSLAIRFASRPFASIEARLSSKVHLGPIGVEEVEDLLATRRPSRGWTTGEIEILHRDCSGNPGKLLRMVGPPTMAELPAVSPALASGVAPASFKPQPAEPMPLTGPTRPPIQSEDHMIEVGWSPEDATSALRSDPGVSISEGPQVATEGGDEAVRDHYAALQAWREWSNNQARQSARALDDLEDDSLDDDEEPIRPEPPTTRVDRPNVRVEGEQKFAPFGHLFSKMSQPLEPE